MKRKKKRDRAQSGSGPDNIRVALDAQVQAAAGKIPPEVMAKVLRIREIITGMLPRLARLPLGSPEFFLIDRTATYYLPTALQNYMALPRASAATRSVLDGKTAKQILLEQLSLLETRMAEIAVDVDRNDVDRLLAHGRFLEERMARSPLSLKLPPSNDAAKEKR